MIDEELIEDAIEISVEGGPGQVESERPSDTAGNKVRLEVELHFLIADSFAVPAILGHEIFVLAEEKQLLRHEGPHPAEKLVGKREIPRCPRETDVPALDIGIVEDPG
jgi:hypothetical protein